MPQPLVSFHFYLLLCGPNSSPDRHQESLAASEVPSLVLDGGDEAEERLHSQVFVEGVWRPWEAESYLAFRWERLLPFALSLVLLFLACSHFRPLVLRVLSKDG